MPSPFVNVREAEARGELALGMTLAEARGVMGPPALSSGFWIQGHHWVTQKFQERPGLPPSVTAVFKDGRLVETRRHP